MFVIYWDGTVVPCCQVADGEMMYTTVSSKYAYREILEGIQSIYCDPPEYCRTCTEVKCKIPVGYKLGEEHA
jgi:hypothetical protein